jgi:SAM-dependent methyltransferase
VNPDGPGGRGRSRAAGSLSTDADRAWFERLYAAAEIGGADVPWDKGAPHHLLKRWVQDRGSSGDGRRAMVVGCGMGRDSEYLAGLGFATVAFDFSPTAITAVRRRFPDSPVDYRVADLLDPLAEWAGAFDLVVESLTVQSLPRQLRPAAITRVRELVAPAGRCWSSPPSRAPTRTRPTAPGRSPGPRSSRSRPATWTWSGWRTSATLTPTAGEPNSGGQGRRPAARSGDLSTGCTRPG